MDGRKERMMMDRWLISGDLRKIPHENQKTSSGIRTMR